MSAMWLGPGLMECVVLSDLADGLRDDLADFIDLADIADLDDLADIADLDDLADIADIADALDSALGEGLTEVGVEQALPLPKETE